jgi:hypothetical protein
MLPSFLHWHHDSFLQCRTLVGIACDEGALHSWALAGEITNGLAQLGRSQMKLAVVAKCHIPMIATSKDCDPFWVPWSFIVQKRQKCQSSPGFIGLVNHFNTMILDQSACFLSWVSCPMLDIFFSNIAFVICAIKWRAKPWFWAFL